MSATGPATHPARQRPIAHARYRRRQTTPTDDSVQNYTGPLGGPVMITELHSESLVYVTSAQSFIEVKYMSLLPDESPLVQWQDPVTLFGPLTIVSLFFTIALSVSIKFSPGGRSPPAWLFQNPRCPPRWPPRTYKSMILHNVRSKYSIIALLVLIIMFLTTWNLIITLI